MDTASNAHPLIRSVYVAELFGAYTYSLQFPQLAGDERRLTLLHGDNGSGKTTLLRLIWNLLSAAETSGHRTFMSQTPFRSLVVNLRGSRRISVEKVEGLYGSYALRVDFPDRPHISVHFEASDDHRILQSRGSRTQRVRSTATASPKGTNKTLGSWWVSSEAASSQRASDLAAEQEYLEFLREEIAPPLLLADDRSLYSDDTAIQQVRVDQQVLAFQAAPDMSSLILRELDSTVQRANEYLRSLTLGGQTAGSMNSDSVYSNFLRQLAVNERPLETVDNPGPAAIDDLLRIIARQSVDYTKYGLVPRFDVDTFSTLLQDISDPDRQLIASRVLRPYLSGLQARFDALSDAKNLLNALIPSMNSFLRNKELSFSPGVGLQIVASTGEVLSSATLSSGERQLMMLLCSTLLARESTSLFIIDEPELSLGIEWQRKILPALLALTIGSDVQFVIATHSIEIISGAIESLVTLSPS